MIKNGEEITKNVSYILQFIDSARFMASSLSNLVNYLCEELHRIKYKSGHGNKKCDTHGISIATVFLNTHNLKMI